MGRARWKAAREVDSRTLELVKETVKTGLPPPPRNPRVGWPSLSWLSHFDLRSLPVPHAHLLHSPAHSPDLEL